MDRLVVVLRGRQVGEVTQQVVPNSAGELIVELDRPARRRLRRAGRLRVTLRASVEQLGRTVNRTVTTTLRE
jgi:hypothetical protein